MHQQAAAMKAAALTEAAEVYSNARRKKMGKGRSPLRPMTNGREFVPTGGFPMPPRAESGEAVAAAAASTDAAAEVVAAAAVRTEQRLAKLTVQSVAAVVISGTSVVRHLEGPPFTLYQLHVPLLAGEHVAFRRYSDFESLDVKLRALLDEPPLLSAWLARAACLRTEPLPRALPYLPPKTVPWVQGSTSPSVVAHRWGALQKYLDAALERAVESPQAWESFMEFLCID